MTGSGSSFSAAGKTYRVRPLTLKETVKFSENPISINMQFYNMLNEDMRKTVDRYLKTCVTDENDKPVTLQKAIDDNWDLGDLQNAIDLICKLGG